MNKYEKLGRSIVCYFIAFLCIFAFAATGMVFINLLDPLSAIETLKVCLIVGTVFGFLGISVVWEMKFK